MKTIIMFCLWVLSMVMLYADEMNTKYIFAYFKGNGEDGLHLAESQDGYVWKTLTLYLAETDSTTWYGR